MKQAPSLPMSPFCHIPSRTNGHVSAPAHMFANAPVDGMWPTPPGGLTWSSVCWWDHLYRPVVGFVSTPGHTLAPSLWLFQWIPVMKGKPESGFISVCHQLTASIHCLLWLPKAYLECYSQQQGKYMSLNYLLCECMARRPLSSSAE